MEDQVFKKAVKIKQALNKAKKQHYMATVALSSYRKAKETPTCMDEDNNFRFIFNNVNPSSSGYLCNSLISIVLPFEDAESFLKDLVALWESKIQKLTEEFNAL